MNRRSFLLSALAAPAIVRASSLMAVVPVKLWPSGEWDYSMAGVKRRLAEWAHEEMMEALMYGRSKSGLIEAPWPSVPFDASLVAAQRA